MSKRAKPLTIVVVGAGIAGLSAAIGLTRAGHRVIVLDRNPSTYDGGAGILLPRNTIRVLDHWGLQKEFLEVVDVVEHNEVRTHNEGALIRRQYGVGFPGSGDRCLYVRIVVLNCSATHCTNSFSQWMVRATSSSSEFIVQNRWETRSRTSLSRKGGVDKRIAAFCDVGGWEYH